VRNGCLVVAIFGLVACALLVYVAVIERPGEVKQDQFRPTAAPTPDPRQDTAWLKTRGGRLFTRLHKKYPRWEQGVWDAVAAHRVLVGMDATQCELSWGMPHAINQTTTAFGIHYQWCYGEFCKPALYFDHGLVTVIQE